MSGTNDKCPAPETGQGHSPPYIKGGVSRSVSTELEHRTILLSEAASKHLLEAGSFFAVIQRGSHPTHDGNRMVIHCLPCDYATAAAAVEVAQGIRKPGKRIVPPATLPDALTSMQDGTTGA